MSTFLSKKKNIHLSFFHSSFVTIRKRLYSLIPSLTTFPKSIVLRSLNRPHEDSSY